MTKLYKCITQFDQEIKNVEGYNGTYVIQPSEKTLNHTIRVVN